MVGDTRTSAESEDSAHQPEKRNGASERRIGLLVLGMHRSGTSALTRVLSLLGAALPENLMPPLEENNEAGFWESERLKDVHDRMLVEAHSGWSDWRAFDPSVLGPDRLAFYREEILRRLAEEFGDASLLVVKDPRICRFVPLYEELLASREIEPRFLHIDRNPLAVIASLAKRDGMTEGFAGLLWLRHVLDAERATRGKPRAFLSYETLLADWRGTVERVTRTLGLTWPRGLDAAAADVEAHLSRDLQHHAPKFEELELSGAIPAWIKASYAALQALSRGGGESNEALATLASVRGEFEQAAAIFGRATFPELAARLGKQSAAHRRVVDERDARIGDLKTGVVQRDARIANLEGAVERRDTWVAELKADVAQRDARIADLDAAVARRDARLEELSAQLAASERTISALRDQIAAIYRSRSWRLLAPVRGVFNLLHRSLLYFGRTVEAQPCSGVEVAATDGRVTEWEMTDEDPQLDLVWPRPHPLPAGRYRLSFEMPDGGKQLDSPRIYVHSGAGFDEETRIDLRLQSAGAGRVADSITLPDAAFGLRFDPSVVPGKLSLGEIRIRRIGRIERYGRLLVGLLVRGPRDPRSGARGLLTAVKILWTGGPRGLAASLRNLEANPTSSLSPVQTRPVRPAPESAHRASVRRIAGRAARPETPAESTKGRVLVVGHASAALLFGAERSLLDVVGALRRNGYRVHAVLPHDNPEYFDAVLEHVDSLSVFPYPWWQAARGLDERAVSRFMAVMRELRIQVVHVNTTILREPLEAARRLGVKSVVHTREILTEDPDLSEYIGLKPEEIVAQVRAGADYLIANSDAARRAFGGEDDSFRVYNGVDVDRLDIVNPVSSSEIRVGLISSNAPKKGLADFVRLAALAQKELPKLHFVLIGPLNQHVRKLTAIAGVCDLPANLELAGHASDPRAAVEQVNVVMNLSSFAESFGRTIAEAMAARRPVIVYDHGALPELVRPGIDGYVIPHRRYEQALEPLRLFCEEPARIAEMGEQARSRAVERFSLDAMAESLGAAYQTIMQSVPAPDALVEPLRVAYFLWHFPVPSETFVLNELRELVERGIDVTVFCRHSPHRDFAPDFRIEWRQVATPEELATELRRTERTIVHSHFTYPTVTDFVWPACERVGVPFTFIAHSQDIFRYENESRNRIAEISRSPQCRKIFVPGRFHHAYLVERGVAPEKLMINPQLSDALLLAEREGARQVGKRFDRRRICAVQRLVEKKGIEYLIDAAPGLEKLGVSVDVYGYGPLERDLAARIERVGAGNVRLHGAVENREHLLEVFAEHDLLVAPSVRAADGDMDGMPTVLMEAMGTGLPVLSTRISSVPDLIRDGVEGLLCEPADAPAIVAAVERFYRMPEGRIRAIAETAAESLRTRYGPERLMGNLLRVWRNDTVDILIVTWKNLPQLREVVERIFRYTTLPFQLIFCDNDSAPEVVKYLATLAEQHPNVTVIHKGYNSYVGPGTNTAMAAGSSRYAIYVCGKEGFVLDFGWETAIVEYMEAHPDVGLAGSLGYSPTYLTGRQYIESHPGFESFRNPDFAAANPDRIFRHVQGGVFVIRRAMWEEIGGFSEALPHLHTDTEYSYYAESRGWRLGRVPGVLSLYNKTRPGILSRLDDNVLVVHPGELATAELLDRVAVGRVALCNLCGWHGDAFAGDEGRETCPECGSGPAQRTIYRYVAESRLTHRQLPGLYVNPHPSLEPIWRQQFGDRILSLQQLDEDDVDAGFDGSAALVLVDAELDGCVECTSRLTRLNRMLTPDGILLTWDSARSSEQSPVEQRDLLATSGFQVERQLRYASQVVRFDWRVLSVFRKAAA